jgi:hypothetical protein
MLNTFLKNIFKTFKSYIMKNLINFLAITLLILMTSCGKEESPIQISENPYNYIGQQHNESLGDFQTKHQQEVDAIEQPLEKEAFIVAMLFEQNGISPEPFYDAKALLEIRSDQTISDYNFLNYDQTFEAFGLTDTRAKLSRAMSQLVEIDGRNEDGLASIKKIIRELEIDLMTNNEDSKDYPIVMAYLATMSHSAEYWQGGGNGGGSGAPATKAKWWQTLLADAVGAGIGLLGGGAATVPLAVGFSAAVNAT